MKIKITIHHQPEYDGTVGLMGRFLNQKPYKSVISGPWYDECDTEFYGDTPEDAESQAMAWVFKLREAANNVEVIR